MYQLIAQSRSAQVVLGLSMLLATGLLGFYLGVRHEGGGDRLSSPYTSQRYVSTDIGISFEYPEQLGAPLEQVLERGECDPGLLTDSDRCEHRYIGFTEKGEAQWFLSAESRLYTLHPLPREGSYEDTLTTAKIEDYCSHGLYPLSCTKSVNRAGLQVFKVGYSPACNGFEGCTNEVFFLNFIETRNPDYPVIAVWYDRTAVNPIPDSVIDEVVQSVRPLQTGI